MWPVLSDGGDVLWIVQALLLAVGLPFVGWLSRRTPRLWTRGVLDAVEQLGLLRGTFFRTSVAVGEVEGVQIQLKLEWTVFGRELALRVMEPLHTGLALGPEPTFSLDEASFGDPTFDRVVRVTSGDPARALAVLDPATRERVAAAVGQGALLGPDGWSRTWLLGDAEPTGAELVRVVRAVARAHLAVARACSRKSLAGTIERLRSDRAAGVRRHALRVLLASGQATSERLAPSLRDLDPELRLDVATRLGAWDVVAELARTGSRTWRVRAAERLAAAEGRIPTGAYDAVQDVLVGALTDPELAVGAAEALGRIGDPRALPSLGAAAASGPAREPARAAAARIRARHAHSAGGLSLPDDGETGRLSLAAGDGRLGRVEPE